MCDSQIVRGGETDAALNHSVVERIKSEMSAAGLTQVALSSKTGIKRPTLVRRLQGRSPLRIDEIEAIAQALGCPVGSLLPMEAA